MSIEAPAPRRPRAKAEKKSIWRMDLGSKGRKAAEADEDVEHPPFVPGLPHVNLLPQPVRDSIAVAHIRKRLVVAAVLLGLVAGGVWYLQTSKISLAQSAVAAATQENQKLRSDVEALAPVKQMYEQITRLQEVVTSTLAAQPQAAAVIQQLAAAGEAAGDGKAINFTNTDVVYTGIPKPGAALNACPNPDPFGTEMTIGCVTFSAAARNSGQVSDLLRTLEADPMFVGPYVTSLTVADLAGVTDAVAFSGSVGISLEGLETKLTPEQIDAILNPPVAAPSPSASGAPVGEKK
jgi:Tfp pilus assembly protein PilN